MTLSSFFRNVIPIYPLLSYFFSTHSITPYSNIPIKVPKQLIDNCKGIVLDMDGVIRIGNKPITNAIQSIQNIYNKQIPTIIITNECRRTPNQIRKDLNSMGLNIPNEWKIISASYLCKEYLRNKLTIDSADMKFRPHLYSSFKIVKRRKKKRKIYNNPKISIGVIGDSNLFYYLKSKINFPNIEFLSAMFILNKMKNNKENNTIYNNYHTNTKFKYIVIGGISRKKIKGDTINLLKLSKQWIRNNPDAEIIFTCPDINDPENNKQIENILPSFIWNSIWTDKIHINMKKSKNTQNQSCFENIEKSEIMFTKYIDSYNKYYIDTDNEVNKKERNNVYVCGKPNLDLKDIFMDNFEIKEEEDLNKILIIGDNPETDIKLSNLINTQSILVLSGILSSKEKQLEYSNHNPEILQECKPNYILNDISELI